MKNLLTIISVIFFASPSFAQNDVNKALEKNADKPINIKSESLSISTSNNTAIFTDNVIVTQGDMILKANEMKVFSERQKNETKNKFKRIEAYGKVIMTSTGREARSNKAIYDVKAGRIEMYENVYLKENGNTLQGSKFLYDINSGKTAISGGASQTSEEAPTPASMQTEQATPDGKSLLEESFGDIGVPQSTQKGRVKVEFVPGEEMKNFDAPRPPIKVRSSTEQRQRIN